MKLLIIGGGIGAVYLANKIKKEDMASDVTIISDESYPPYDRIHLCRLVTKDATIDDIKLQLNETVKLHLNQKIIKIDPLNKEVFSVDRSYSYDKLIIATGSKPNTLFDISGLKNVALFRDANDCFKISDGVKGKDVVLVGSGAISLELLESLKTIKEIKTINLIVRSKTIYDKDISLGSQKIIEDAFFKHSSNYPKVNIFYEDEIVEKDIKDGTIVSLKTKKSRFENLFLIFGIGISPNIEFCRDSLMCDRGVLTNLFMQTNYDDIYAVGEAAQVKNIDFIAGDVKECTAQADVAISHIFGRGVEFKREVSISMLKVGSFDLVEIKTPCFSGYDDKMIISNDKEYRVDEYCLKGDKVVKFIGINSNIDVSYIEDLIVNQTDVEPTYLYQNRVESDKGRLICSCEHLYKQDLVEIVLKTGIESFSELKEFSNAGRVCGRCKIAIEDIIKETQSLVDPNLHKKNPQDIKLEKELELAKKRVEKFNKLHPRNNLSVENFESALDSLEIAKQELNSWVSMVTANMQLHPSFEDVVGDGIKSLNKIPIIWLELSDCSGNSEAFIKSTNPAIEDLIFDYISLDYHELLMSASGDDAETVLEDIIKNQKGEYILIVEGAIPLAMDGKYLRIGANGETGVDLLKRCAKEAGLILAVGSCALDGGVVAAKPNPTGAVGVSEALSRTDIINLPGCPVNPINIVGTLLSYLMFEELPQLDSQNRPLWAYEGRIHDNCERRGHYELGEFVQEWGDDGAKKGWCLFEMGCKGPYAFSNCPTMKFNNYTSWPVQAGHGCMGCTEAKFFDKFATERKIKNNNSCS